MMAEMRVTMAVLGSLVSFYANLFFLKVTVIHLVLVLVYFVMPFYCVSRLIRKEDGRDDTKLALILWSLAALPTGFFILMTLMFGLPPEGYGF